MGAEFRFRPRLVAFPWVCAGLGIVVLGVALVTGASGASLQFAIAGGIVGPLIAILYLAAPAWRFRVVVDDEALAVWHGKELRFRVAWGDVRKVVHAPSTKTCYVDTGTAARNLLVPGPGAPAPYVIERREELYDAILAHVPAERREAVETLAAARKEAR